MCVCVCVRAWKEAFFLLFYYCAADLHALKRTLSHTHTHHVRFETLVCLRSLSSILVF